MTKRCAQFVAAMVLGAVALTGCGSQSGTPGGLSSPTGAGTAGNGCPSPKEGFQKGLAILWKQVDASPANAQLATDLVSYVRSLGANAVSINFLISTSGLHGNSVYPGQYTPTVASLGQIVAAAKTAHLRVALRPIIDESNIPRPQWRGTIRPTSRAAWFQSYGDVMTSYAHLAQSNCVDEFVIGTELNSMQRNASAWTSTASRVRSAGYTGDITYAANWDAPMRFGFEPRAGVDFYPKLPITNSVTTAQLASAMVAAFRSMPAPFVKSVVIQETGLSAYGGRYNFPSLWNPGSAPTFQEQANWFTAVCGAARQIGAGGLYFWGLDSGTDPLHPDPNMLGTFAFVGRPAAQAAAKCFAQKW